MKKEFKEPVWKTEPISPTCEVMTGSKRFCGLPTVAAYPACGGG